jgi:hypothetical protein
MRIKSATTLLLVTIFTISIISAIFYTPPSKIVSASPDWLVGWNNRRLMTIDGSKVDAALTDFPVLVKLQSSFFDFSKAQGNGQDVRFTSSDGTTLLKYEIEKWNSAGGEAYVWVKIPSVTSGSDTTFYTYYGNAGASDGQEKTSVWNSNFKMVQHLKETSGTHLDSSSNANNGSPLNGVVQGTTGKIDGADSFDGTNDYVDCGNSSSLTQTEFAIEAWIRRNGTGVATSTGTGGMLVAEPLIAKGRGYAETIGLNVNYFLGINQGNKTFGFDFEDNITGLNHPISGTTTVTDGQWYYVVATHNGTSALYINGALGASNLTARTADYNPWSVSVSTAISGAGAGTPAGYFNGTVDEVRISNKAFSAAWVKASYNSGNNSLLTYGTEEQIAPAYSNVAVTSTKAGSSCEFQVKWSDADGLDKCLFSTNNTGVWQNESLSVSGTESWANKTLTLTSVAGDKVGYRWYCNDTDGNMGDTGGRTLTTSGDWWYYKKIVFNNALISENLVNFPVLINLTKAGSEFWSHVGSSYHDLRFVDADGTTDLHFEVEYWNYAANEALVWVKVPTIDANSATDFIYVYYGNPSPPPSSFLNSPQTWNADFRMVQHLEETSGTQFDSTINDNDGTPTNGVTQGLSPSLIDGADRFDGTNQYVNCTNNASLRVTTFTLEAWINKTGTGVATGTGSGGFPSPSSIIPVLTKGKYQVDDPGYNVNYFIGIVLSNNTVGFDFEDNTNGGNHPLCSITAITNSQWYYLTATYDGTSMKIYINGALDIARAFSNSTTVPDTNPWSVAIASAISGPVGGTPARDGAFAGLIDEARISSGARSAEWIKAQYLSMGDQFVTFEGEVFVIPEYWLGALLGLVACFAAFGFFTRFKRIKAKNFSQRNLGV